MASRCSDRRRGRSRPESQAPARSPRSLALAAAGARFGPRRFASGCSGRPARPAASAPRWMPARYAAARGAGPTSARSALQTRSRGAGRPGTHAAAAAPAASSRARREAGGARGRDGAIGGDRRPTSPARGRPSRQTAGGGHERAAGRSLEARLVRAVQARAGRTRHADPRRRTTCRRAARAYRAWRRSRSDDRRVADSSTALARLERRDAASLQAAGSGPSCRPQAAARARRRDQAAAAHAGAARPRDRRAARPQRQRLPASSRQARRPPARSPSTSLPATRRRGPTMLPLTALPGASTGRRRAACRAVRRATVPRFGTAIVRNGIEIGDRRPRHRCGPSTRGASRFADCSPVSASSSSSITAAGVLALRLPAAVAVARGQRGPARGRRRVGSSPARRPALYFELRVDGQPVDPLQWLKP